MNAKLEDSMEWTNDDEFSQTEDWQMFQDTCYDQINKDVSVLRSAPSLPANEANRWLSVQDMVASVLAVVPYDQSRFGPMYEILKIIEDKKFWADVDRAFQSPEATSPSLPFTNRETLLAHAVAVERIYLRHQFDKLEDLLV